MAVLKIEYVRMNCLDGSESFAFDSSVLLFDYLAEVVKELGRC